MRGPEQRHAQPLHKKLMQAVAVFEIKGLVGFRQVLRAAIPDHAMNSLFVLFAGPKIGAACLRQSL